MSSNQSNEAEIFDRARGIELEEARREYLDQVCADPDVRKRIERLLAEDQDYSFLKNPALGGSTITHSVERIGTTVGPYELLERIGEGGMGTVYLAQQFEPVKRRVAIKLVKSGNASSNVIARFETERQALALMEHPNIAKFYDAGSTASGSPYFVMEYVPGLPVTDYCDEKRFSVEERLVLFRKICQAVQHAHQKGIIHRDLKPSNILVTQVDDEAVPKIIDFGLAKATEAHLTDDALLTNFGQILGTLQYMSPEQTRANVADIDTRADIYSLGAILYELLVGSPPFEISSFQTRALDEVFRMIREEDPPTPKMRLNSTQTNSEIAGSRRLDIDKMNRLVKGDLEWIVMRSLEKDRARRYQTADAFADDIHRFIEFRPIDARAPSILYRTRKFLLRNRVGVTVASSVLLTALIGISLGFWMVNQTRHTARIEGLAESLLTAEIEEVPQIIEQLSSYGASAGRYLQGIQASTDAASPECFRVELALLQLTEGDADAIGRFILSGSPGDVRVIRSQLEGRFEQLDEDLWSLLDAAETDGQLLNVASVLALYDSDHPRWRQLSDRIVSALLGADPFSTPIYVELLSPIGPVLKDSLFQVLLDSEAKYTAAHRNLVANVANKYFAGDVNQIIDFILASDPSQFKILVGSLQSNPAAAIARLKQELNSDPEASWNDSPLNPAWRAPGEREINSILEAGGIFEERFALCQSLSMEEFVRVSQSLRASGYRPIRCRPYSQQDTVQVAAIWTRDDRDWKFVQGQTKTEFQESENSIRQQGLIPIDVARYVDRADQNPDLVASIWVKKNESEYDSIVVLEQMTNEIWRRIRPSGYNFQHSIHRNFDSLGRTQRAYTIANHIIGLGEYFDFGKLEQFRSIQRQREIHWDISLTLSPAKDVTSSYPWSCRSVNLTSKTGPLNTRMKEQLGLADALLRDAPEDLNALRDRAIANHFLRRDADAIRDLSQCIDANVKDGFLVGRRAVSYARMGQSEKAWADIEKYRTINSDPDVVKAFEAGVDLFLGDHESGLEKLEIYLAEHPERNRAGFLAAHPYSLAAEMLQFTDKKKSAEYATRAVELLRLSMEGGLHLPVDMILELPDFEFIRGKSPFADIVRDLEVVTGFNPGLRIDAQWQCNTDFKSQVIIEPNPRKHQEAASEIAESGFRPQAISSVFWNKSETIHTASVWHQPLVTEEAQDANAERKSLIALALIHIGAADLAWPELKFNSEPRLRSCMISRMADCGITPDVLLTKLRGEINLGIRQSLLLMLGEIENWGPGSGEIGDYLLGVFRNDPNAGIHSATEWALRMHGHSKAIAEIQTRLAGIPKRDVQTWHVSPTGHTMVEIEGPVEFTMGNHQDGYHQQRISRSYAIATKELTSGQMMMIQKRHPESQLFEIHYELDPFTASLENACGGISLINAAKVCRLLSELEGVPEDQMCFPPVDEITPDMVLPEDYLLRTGYRLPTQAEWEYAARGGTTLERHFGNSKELLAEFAWFAENSQGISRPVGRLKPNDFGLFDTVGNTSEYAINFSNYSRGGSEEVVYEDDSRTPLRNSGFESTRSGPGFFDWHREVKVGQHHVATKTGSYSFSGIRLARTIKSATDE